MNQAEIAAANHPCYTKEASKKYGRMHLPVAPKCNISCNYCNRKYDCANESRPGVTSKVLSPEEAFEVFKEGKKQMPYITTVGIAGPGDSLANADRTLKTLELIHREFPEVNLCLSTNGLLLSEYANDLVDLNALFITVTVNATTPETAAKVYRSVRYNGKTYRGEEGAGLLLEKQIEGIEALRGRATVKVNSVYIPEVNANEILGIADMATDHGAYLMNLTPLIPVDGSLMEGFRKPSDLEMESTKSVIERTMKLMDHCKQCRSDACGLLSEKENSVLDVKREARMIEMEKMRTEGKYPSVEREREIVRV